VDRVAFDIGERRHLHRGQPNIFADSNQLGGCNWSAKKSTNKSQPERHTHKLAGYEQDTKTSLAKPQASPGAFNALGNGYLLGWSNSGFDQRTEFHVWRFVLAPHPVPWFLPAGR